MRARRCVFKLPFGEELGAGVGGRTAAQGYAVGDNVRQKFATYERDLETGLDYAQARYFASAQGRFTSIDPLLASGDPANPQSWNRYSYTINNPLKYVDPSGLIWGYRESGGNRYFTWYDDISALESAGDTAYTDSAYYKGSGQAVWLGDKAAWAYISDQEYTDGLNREQAGDSSAPFAYNGLDSRFWTSLLAHPQFDTAFGLATMVGSIEYGAAKAATGGLAPVLKGKAGADKAIAKIVAEGGEVVGTEITMQTTAARTRIDIFFRNSDGTFMFGEVKNGPFARLTLNQSKAFPLIETIGGIPRGANAAQTGVLRPGVPIGPVPIRRFNF